MRAHPALALALLLAIAPALVASPALAGPDDGPVVVDRVVAVVGDRIITASDVALEEVLARHDPSPVAAVQARRADPLRSLVDLAIARGLAGDVAVYQPTSAEVRERLAAIRGQFPDPRDWQAVLAASGHTEEQLAGALYSRIVAERYVARNVTSPAESRQDAGGAAEAYQRWLVEQRGRVAIRIVPPIGQQTAEAGP